MSGKVAENPNFLQYLTSTVHPDPDDPDASGLSSKPDPHFYQDCGAQSYLILPMVD